MAFLKIFILFGGILSGNCMPSDYTKHSQKREEFLSTKYKPVVLIHGLFGTNSSLQELAEIVEKKHPGTDVHNIHIFNGQNSFASLWKQIKGFYNEILPIMKNSNGINIVAFSQGGLIARGIVEMMNDHKVHNLISLSAPQAGQYGGAYLSQFGVDKEKAYKYLYLNPIYRSFSVAQFWNDPLHQNLYLKYCEVLPYLNNEIKGREKEEYKNNLNRLNKLVLIGGPDDGVLSPWQSSHFSFYNEKMELIDFRQREIYSKDLFGLKSLDDSNKIQIYVKKNIDHFSWPKNEEVINDFVLPWLD